MVLDGNEPRPISRGRRVERHQGQVRDLRCKGTVRTGAGCGFRVAKYIQPLPPALVAPVGFESLGRDARKEQPVGDDIFEVYRRQYAYDSTPLSVVEEATEETAIWRRHTVVIHAAYGAEHMRVHLFLPKHGWRRTRRSSSFHRETPSSFRRAATCRFAGGSSSFAADERSSTRCTKGPTSERRLTRLESTKTASSELRGRGIRTRHRLPLDATGYRSGSACVLRRERGQWRCGSDGLEPRLKTSVLSGAGIVGNVPPEWDALNYAPRIGIPTLMLNGRYDSEVPLETAQRPLFDLLGTPAERKRHQTFETVRCRGSRTAGEILPWLDRYLGPVVR